MIGRVSFPIVILNEVKHLALAKNSFGWKSSVTVERDPSLRSHRPGVLPGG